MPLTRVEPHDAARLAQAFDLLEAARRVDDPTSFAGDLRLEAARLEYGWDLEPDERYLYTPDGAADPVGVLDIALPRRDNLHLVWGGICVHPDHRRLGHGTAMMREILRRAEEADRDTIWLGTAEDDLGARAFLERFGFSYASHDARRRQVLADVDGTELARLYEVARVAAGDYRLERLQPPYSDDLLQQLVEVTAAINDAPMGELTFEDEKFDLQRLRDIETARIGRGDDVYRVIARHAETGEVGGHTVMIVHPLQPTRGHQGDTAVHRDHRGHRLGLLLKIEMLRWLAEVAPQLEVVETWNHADNRYMIDVNEAIGYRLDRVFAMFELSTRNTSSTETDAELYTSAGV